MEELKSILEGSDRQNPHLAEYSDISDIYIPQNAGVLKIGSRLKLFHYGTSNDCVIESLKTFPKPHEETAGFKIGDSLHFFSMPRSIVTSNGKIFLNEIFYTPGWEYYFSFIDSLLQDCKQAFEQGTLEKITQRRIF